jgi:transcriptional regulator with XRE-family HTH domain
MARALLLWSQAKLASKAKVAGRTVALFETGERSPRAVTLTKIRKTLERAGALFVDGNGEGPGVRKRK